MVAEVGTVVIVVVVVVGHGGGFDDGIAVDDYDHRPGRYDLMKGSVVKMALRMSWEGVWGCGA